MKLEMEPWLAYRYGNTRKGYWAVAGSGILSTTITDKRLAQAGCFDNNELNRNAQLIATVHDVSLLDCQTLFRKEQIWFTHKDRENAYLYSLAEFTAEKTGVRETSDLIEKYRKGMFGALPEPDLFQSLLEVKNRD